MKLTTQAVLAQPRPEPGKQVILRCEEVKAFGVRLTSGSASYIVETKSNGKPRRLTLGSFEEMTPDQARREALRLLSYGDTTCMPTLFEVLTRFLETRNLKPISVLHYKSVLQRCIGDWFHLRFDQITKDMVLQRHRELTKPTRQGSDGRAQANKALEILRVLFNFAVDTYESDAGEPVLQHNPVTTLNRNRSWHKTKQRQRVIPDAKLPLWYAEVMKLRQITVRDYLLVLLLTGLRRMECAKLQWVENIDFDGRIITVSAAMTKNSCEHQLPISDFLLALLKRRYEEQSRSTQYVFPGRGGKGHMVDSSLVIAQMSQKMRLSVCLARLETHDAHVGRASRR